MIGGRSLLNMTVPRDDELNYLSCVRRRVVEGFAVAADSSACQASSIRAVSRLRVRVFLWIILPLSKKTIHEITRKKHARRRRSCNRLAHREEPAARNRGK